jgi:hypothetical protein
MISIARTLAERQFLKLKSTDEITRAHIEEDATIRAEKIARLRNLRLAAIRDESESVARAKITKSNRP